MRPLKYWTHRYDGVEVNWSNPFTGESGVEKAGVFGWNQRILKIDNYFIQYRQLALLIAEKYNDFFAVWRNENEFKTFNIFQLENRDKFDFNHNGEFDFSTATEWMIQNLDFDFWSGELKINGLEIKS